MPTYDYRCDACSHEFEKFQKMSAGASRKCPACGERRLKRLLGMGAGVIFKGSGFYETDYKRKSGPASGDSGESGGSNGTGSSNGKGGSNGTGATKPDPAPKTESTTGSKD